MKSRLLTFTLFCFLAYVSAAAINIKGRVTDKSTKEPLIGATVMIEGTTHGVTTDWDGYFEIESEENTCILKIQYVSYATVTIKVTAETAGEELAIELEPEQLELQEVMVTAQARRNTEASLINAARQSLVVQSGVSAQQIKKTQDSNASEVIKRVPGISLIDERFVMVRGLSQRYNNVWLNNSAVPSSEADSRAYSFDMIPSSQLDNMIIIKSPSPEYPADFSGGFVMINTKDIPMKNFFKVSLGGSINDNTHFQDFQYSLGSSTDFLGFDNGFRSLDGGISGVLKNIAGDGVNLQGNGFNNDWRIRNKKPVADVSFNAELNRRWISEEGRTFALLGSLNYGNSYRTILNMENSLFGAYDVANDRPVYLRNSRDNQYNHYAKVGAMLNLTYLSADGNHRYEFKNIFNQIGRDRYTSRVGINAQSNNEQSAEYYYMSRTTYNGQFTGRHQFTDNRKFDWSVGYAYANNCMPDRRRYVINDALEKGKLGLTSINDIEREFTRLNEHTASVNVNYRDTYTIGQIEPELRVGAYSDYRTRSYRARDFIYTYNAANNTLPSGFMYMDIPTELLVDGNYGADKLYMLENVRWTNNYDGNNWLMAGYIGINIPINKFNVYAGVRYEYNKMELISNTRNYEKSPRSLFYETNDFFPSMNATYRFTDKHQARMSYGRSINRPEFREVSPSVYYDFDLASNVQGNTGLESAYIDNVDLSYEFYPASGELVSVSLFYKHFKNPIEWTYTVNGGTSLTYSYENAESANTYGVELEIKKNLDFMGLDDFSINFNGALIKSMVVFPEDSKEKDRPMQGQSPYLINAGIFYQPRNLGLNVALLYNRIGKRIIGVGRSLGSGDNVVNIPDSYEMPRNTLDLSASKKFGDHFEVKLSLRNILSEDISYKQFEETEHGEVEEVTRQFDPGRNYSISVSYSF